MAAGVAVYTVTELHQKVCTVTVNVSSTAVTRLYPTNEVTSFNDWAPTKLSAFGLTTKKNEVVPVKEIQETAAFAVVKIE